MKSNVRTTRHRRIRAKVKGTATRPRACLFRSASRVSIQLIDDTAGKTLLSVYGELSKKMTKTQQAQVVGKEVAAAAKKQGITHVVFDRGGYKYHGRVKAVAEAMREHGLIF